MSRPTTPTPPPLLNDHDSDSDEQQLVPNHSSTIGRQGSEIPIPKTPSKNGSRSQTVTPKSHSRRATPRSNTRHSTPGRGSVRRNPSTPYTLRAMLQVSAATPVRNLRRETKRYTPRDDLRYLSRLLVRERDMLSERHTQTIEEVFTQDSEEPITSISPARLQLQPAPVITTYRVDEMQSSQTIDYVDQHAYSARLSEIHHTTTLSELDEEQRRLSERMSGRFSFPSNNLPSDLFTDLAVPEAVVDDPSQFDNENFGYDDDYSGLQRPANFTSDDDDDLDNDLVYSDNEFDFSLLKNQAVKSIFKPITSTSHSNLKSAHDSLKIPISLLRSRGRQFLLQAQQQDAKFFKQKQFSKEMLEQIQNISDEFLTQQMSDLESFAKHANRKTINSDDFALMLKRQKNLNIDSFDFSNPRSNEPHNKSTELFCLAEVFCNVSELREIEANLYKNEMAIAKRQLKKRRKIEVKDEKLVTTSDSDEDLSQFVDTRESLD